MKMLRWGYAYSLLALALCVTAAPRHANAAIYASSLNATWTITSLEINVLGTIPTPNDALDIVGDAFQDDGFSGFLTDGAGDAEFNVTTNIIGSASEMNVGDSIQLGASATGEALSAVSSASSEAMAVGSLDFSNPFPAGDLEVTVQLDLNYSYDLLAEALTSEESAQAGFEIKLFDATSTLFSNSILGQAPLDNDGGGPFSYSFELGGGQSRELFLSAYAHGSASFVDPNNSGGGPGGNNDPNAVPEPSTIAIWSLFGIVGLTVGAIRRRRK